MRGKNIANWANLAGHVVCIRRGEHQIRIGQVDQVTPAGDVLWLQSDGGSHARSFKKADGYTAWTAPTAPVQEALIDHIRICCHPLLTRPTPAK